MTVDPTAFEAQMAYLAGHGYHTITFSDLADRYDRGKPLPDNPVIVTFDDGWAEQYTTVYPILRRYGLIATFFPPTNWINGSGLTLSWTQIEEMSQAGMEFGSHTLNHHILPDQTPDEVRRQLAQSKAILEQHTHRPVVVLAYPIGAWSPRWPHWCPVPAIGWRSASSLASSNAQPTGRVPPRVGGLRRAALDVHHTAGPACHGLAPKDSAKANSSCRHFEHSADSQWFAADSEGLRHRTERFGRKKAPDLSVRSMAFSLKGKPAQRTRRSSLIMGMCYP